MSSHRWSTRSARRALAWTATLSVALAACGGAGTGGSTGATGDARETVAASASWEAWVAHKGFGDADGPNEVRRQARWLGEHAGVITLFDLDLEIDTASRLVAWLDANPPTACWAAYHEAVRAHVASVAATLSTAREAVAAGGVVPAETVAAVVTEANAAYELPEPAGCD